jgi:transposase-like protein
MIEVIDAAARKALVAGRPACPSCGRDTATVGPQPQPRRSHPHDSAQATVTVRLHRARCRSCQGTHVLLPAELVARRCYPLRVIGAALTDADQGGGLRSVASRLVVPAATVRSWLRRARANAEALYRLGVQTVVALDPALLPATPRATLLGDALQALAAAASATIARFAPDLASVYPWPVINMLTRGQLLAPGLSLNTPL